MRVNVGAVAILQLVEPALRDLFGAIVPFLSLLDVLPDVGKGLTGASWHGDGVQRLFGFRLLQRTPVERICRATRRHDLDVEAKLGLVIFGRRSHCCGSDDVAVESRSRYFHTTAETVESSGGS